MILTLDLLAALATLSEVEREVVLDAVLLGDTPNEIAHRHSCSSAWIYNVQRRALRKLEHKLRRLHALELVAA